MSTFIFLRHGHSSANAAGLLTGQLPGIGLSPQGRKDAQGLIERIANFGVDYLHVSPIERCQLTIDPWLHSKYSRTLTSMQIVDGISEINFGSWSGRKLTSLRRTPLWKSVQEKPSQVTFPEGESFRKVQRRAVAAVEEMRSMRGDKIHLVVSHSDTIKLITAHYLGMKLDEFQKLTVNPASFTVFRETPKDFSLIAINHNGSLKEILS